MRSIHTTKGVSLIEVLVALGVFALVAGTTIFLLLDAMSASSRGVTKTQALFLAKEGLEATRSIADNNFDDLSSGDHGLLVSSSTWVFSGAVDTQDMFSRRITITDSDADTKDVTSEVVWGSQNDTDKGEVRLTERLTNWRATQDASSTPPVTP